MSDLDSALGYLGLSDIVTSSGDSAEFIDASYSSCGDQLATVAYYFAQVCVTCPAFVALAIGEVPSVGADTLLTLAAGGACAESIRQYWSACDALGQCVGQVDPSKGSQVASAASQGSQVTEEQIAQADQASQESGQYA
jgi:hypothetical protein